MRSLKVPLAARALLLVLAFVALFLLAAAGGVAWGVATTEAGALQRVDQHVNDMGEELKEALAHLPRK